MRLSQVLIDPDGPDANSLNGEYVALTNSGPLPVRTGDLVVEIWPWVYELPPDHVLEPGETVRIHGGSGQNDRLQPLPRRGEPAAAQRRRPGRAADVRRDRARLRPLGQRALPDLRLSPRPPARAGAGFDNVRPTVPLPDFVVVGAQKAGTTSLYRMLRKHPQIHMPRTKELHFFDVHWDRASSGTPTSSRPGRWEWRRGEATPYYLYRPMVRERMLQVLPKARIVVILRNPVDRAYSHYWHDLRRFELERHAREVFPTFETAVAFERPVPAGPPDRP